ncbi:hypothetical protein RclHR1_03860003 [Rhizophagus clarus]|uniref:Protein kinase domain-containing protein n=1 Tax=Rhizophagus clarus TaxID=94130 RepID=A0A2Z6RD26_9GLOM|nr:hypothetical protein RclHR1_03860003 [Rhizophagus clarus]
MHLIKPQPIMHRDIRWPNIIRHYDEYPRFILIDFDYAIFSPADEPLEEFSEIDHAHDFNVDMWGVGNLVVSCSITGIPQELLSFSSDLCNKSPGKRPTASNALDWLKICLERGLQMMIGWKGPRNAFEIAWTLTLMMNMDNERKKK